MKYVKASTYRNHIKEKVGKIQGIEDALKHIESPGTRFQLEWQMREIQLSINVLKEELAELEARGK